jgi:hypothetical protein
MTPYRPTKKAVEVGLVKMKEVEDVRLSVQFNSTLVILIPGKVTS